MIDALGRIIYPGDTVAYPNRHGSVTELCLGEVVSTTPLVYRNGFFAGVNGIRVVRPSGRHVIVKHIERVVVCRRAEIPTA